MLDCDLMRVDLCLSAEIYEVESSGRDLSPAVVSIYLWTCLSSVSCLASEYLEFFGKFTKGQELCKIKFFKY